MTVHVFFCFFLFYFGSDSFKTGLMLRGLACGVLVTWPRCERWEKRAQPRKSSDKGQTQEAAQISKTKGRFNGRSIRVAAFDDGWDERDGMGEATKEKCPFGSCRVVTRGSRPLAALRVLSLISTVLRPHVQAIPVQTCSSRSVSTSGLCSSLTAIFSRRVCRWKVQVRFMMSWKPCAARLNPSQSSIAVRQGSVR